MFSKPSPSQPGLGRVTARILLPILTLLASSSAVQAVSLESTSATTTYHRATVDGVGVFYREAGPKSAPTFVAAGAAAFQRDLPNARIHLLEAGHFALDEKNDEIASLILQFISKLRL